MQINTTVKYHFLPVGLAKMLRPEQYQVLLNTKYCKMLRPKQYQVLLGKYDKSSHILMISTTTLKTTWHPLVKLTILRSLAQEFHSQLHYCFCPSEDTHNQGLSSIVLIPKIWKHPKCALTFK